LKVHPVVKQVLLFVLVFAALNEGIRIYFYNVTAKNMRLVQCDDAFHAIDQPLDFLFLGHSRGLASIDTANHPELFNFCSGGESNIYTYYKLKSILEEGKVTAKVIVMPCGFGSFNMRSISATTNSFYWIKYVDYLELGKHQNRWSEYLTLSLKARLFPYFQRPALALDKTMGSYTGQGDYKKKLADIPTENRFTVALQNLEANSVARSLYDSISLLYLKKTIALCNEKNQPIVFVKYPVTSYYQEAAVEFAKKNDFTPYQIDAVIKASWDKIFVLDYEALYRDQPDMFRDLNHLNKEGAEAFTPHLLIELNTILEQWNAEGSAEESALRL
jgi:hypothetical protein